MNNPSGVAPQEYKVLVKPDKVEEKSKGGIIIPHTEQETRKFASTQGTLVAVSPLAFTFSDWPEGARKPQVGDHVIFPRYLGFVTEGDDGEDYWLLNDRDIIAVRNKA